MAAVYEGRDFYCLGLLSLPMSLTHVQYVERITKMICLIYHQYSARKGVRGVGVFNRFPLILFVEGGYGLCVCVCVYIYIYIQGVSGGIVNILGGGSMDCSE
jgi:hypothetical protein